MVVVVVEDCPVLPLPPDELDWANAAVEIIRPNAAASAERSVMQETPWLSPSINSITETIVPTAHGGRILPDRDAAAVCECQEGDLDSERGMICNAWDRMPSCWRSVQVAAGRLARSAAAP